ncbi:MAG: protein translocase subunit SecF [Deltaproteobacteria bacterium]|nr:protein translocase subunit SecF [Deltaproteobacteria bacterium]
MIDQDRASKLHQAILAKKEQIGGEVKLDLASAGDRIYLRFERNPNRDELQEVFDEQGIEVVQLEQTGRPQDNAFTVHLEELQAKIGAYFKQSFGEKFSEVARVQVVGPKAGEALRNDGILAICVSLLLIVLYVAIRFDFRFSVGALAALFHDPIIILGCFSAFGWEFSLTAIAALLTVIGYSVNDTIIVFDRIREAFGFSRDKDVAKTANQAINETLSRTILTSGTTMLVVLALYFFGGSLLREFTLSLMIGIIVGTYSSIGVASAIMIQMDRVMPRLQALFAGGKQQRAGAGAAAAGSSRRISLGKNS